MKKIFQYVKDFIQKWIGISFEFVKDNSEVAVDVTNKIKKIVDSPIADILTAIIPSDLDDKVVSKLRKVLPIVLEKMAIMHGILIISTSNENTIALIIEHLQLTNKDLRADFYIRLAGELNVALADGEISLAEAIGLSQIIYAEKKISLAA